MGLCLPVSCLNGDIANLTQEYFNAAELDAQIMHDLQPKILKVTDLNPESSLMERRSFQLIG